MIDPLTQLLSDPELNELIRLDLEIALRKDPALFYMTVIAPRAAKLADQQADVDYVSATPDEIAALMDLKTATIEKAMNMTKNMREREHVHSS